MKKDAELLGRVLRAFNREGTMSGAITSLELKRPLDPAFIARARLIAGQMQDVARAMYAVTGVPE
jgi:hypothetical protein